MWEPIAADRVCFMYLDEITLFIEGGHSLVHVISLHRTASLTYSETV